MGKEKVRGERERGNGGGNDGRGALTPLVGSVVLLRV